MGRTNCTKTLVTPASFVSPNFIQLRHEAAFLVVDHHGDVHCHARIVALPIDGINLGTDGLDIRLRVDGLGGLPRGIEILAGRIRDAA